MLTRDRISLGILAGGRASRLGGADKALVEFEGQSLLTRTLQAMGDGYAQRLVSYNGAADRLVRTMRDASRPEVFGIACVIPDRRPDYPGPLAGLEALLHAASSDWLLTVPVDLRNIPPDLMESLGRQAEFGREGKGISLRDIDGLQPLVALWPVHDSRAAVEIALDRGDRAAHRLLQSLQLRIHDISPWRLGNLNAPADFE